MRKLLLEVQEIDRYIAAKMDEGDSLVFEARMIVHDGLAEKVICQRKAMRVIQWFARNSMREQLEAIHAQLMDNKAFRNEVNSI